MILLYPTLIKFKSQQDKDNFAPSCHMFYSRRVIDINDGKPKWTGLNNESELIADSPKEAIEKRKKEKAEQNGQDPEGEDSNKKQKTEGKGQ